MAKGCPRLHPSSENSGGHDCLILLAAIFECMIYSNNIRFAMEFTKKREPLSCIYFQFYQDLYIYSHEQHLQGAIVLIKISVLVEAHRSTNHKGGRPRALKEMKKKLTTS